MVEYDARHATGSSGCSRYSWTLVLVGVHLVPLGLGVLGRPSVVATAAAAAALSLLVPAGAAAPAAAEEASGGDRPASWALAAVAVAAVCVVELGFVLRHVAETPQGIDALTFHVPGVARWIQLGSMWQIDQFVPLLAHGDYPNNGDVVLLSAVLPFHDDFLLRLVFVPFLALTGVAVYALAQELRAPAAAAALFAAVAVALPNVSVDATVNTLPDTVFFLSFVGGVLFLLRHQRTGRTSELVLAGISLGLGFGTKWFGVSSVVATLVVWAGATLLAGRRVATVARQGAALIGLVAATGGIWLVRNLLESGNPIFPQKVAVLGWTIFDAPPDVLREAGGFTIAHYIGRPGVWRSYLIPAFEHSLGLPGAVLAVGFLLGAGLAAWGLRRRSAGAGRALAVVVAAAVLAGVYAITPFTAFGPSGRPFLAFANVRYGVAALLLAAGLAAWSAARLGWARLALELAGVVAVFEGLDRGLGLAFGTEELVIALAGGAAAAAPSGNGDRGGRAARRHGGGLGLRRPARLRSRALSPRRPDVRVDRRARALRSPRGAGEHLDDRRPATGAGHVRPAPG